MRKTKRKIPYFLLAAVLIAYIAFLAVSSLSSGIIGTKRVSFSNGSFACTSDSITVVLLDGETSLLSQFEELVFADFSGSTNYKEIIDWAQANPDVEVFYSVTMPNGSVFDNETEEIDLSGITDADVSDVVTAIGYLPNVRRINLGATELSSSGVQTMKEAFPDKELSYSVSLLNQNLELDTQEVDLTGLTSSDVAQCIDKLGMLSQVTKITVGSNATVNGELTWQDLQQIAEAYPNAVMEYSFTVAGQNVSLSDESLDLSQMSSADVSSVAEVLPSMKQLKTIKVGSITTEEMQQLSQATSAAFDYTLTIYGMEVNLSDEIWDFNHIEVTDAGQEVAKWVPCAKNLKYLDMDSCGVSNADMAAIRDANPNVEVIWRVNFGDNYSVRTNVTKILASKPSKGGTLYNEDVNEALKYCTKVRYLDLGHNENLSDFSFVSYMPDLEIAVISMSSISDLTPFASCSNLIYLEAGNTNIADLSPLANCKNLKHLNVGTCFSVNDISCLYDLDMLRIWLGSGDPVPSEQVAKMKELHPDCEINTTASTGLERDEEGNITSEGYTAENWKFYQKYLTYDWNYMSAYNVFPAQRPLGYFKVVYKAFQYNLQNNAYSFSWNDPKYEAHDSSVQAVNTFIIDTSFLTEYWDSTEDDMKITADVLEDPPGDTLVEATY